MNTVFTLRRSVYGCLVISWLLCSVAAAQSSRLSISASLSPIYTSNFKSHLIAIPPNQGQLVNPAYTQSSTRYGYSVGLSAHYAFSARWSATTGLWVNNFTRAESTFLYNTATNGMITSRNAGTRVSARTYQVPLLANYRTSDKKLAAYFSAGVLISLPPPATDYLISENNDYALLRSSRGKVLPMIGAGISYRLDNHFSFLAQPTLMVEFADDEYILYNAYRVGLLTQLTYTF